MRLLDTFVSSHIRKMRLQFEKDGLSLYFSWMSIPRDSTSETTLISCSCAISAASSTLLASCYSSRNTTSRSTTNLVKILAPTRTHYSSQYSLRLLYRSVHFFFIGFQFRRRFLFNLFGRCCKTSPHFLEPDPMFLYHILLICIEIRHHLLRKLKSKYHFQNLVFICIPSFLLLNLCSGTD